MKGYKFGVAWIAVNDEPTIRDAEEIAGFISTLLLADLFDKPADKVAADILAERTRDHAAEARKVRKPRAKLAEPFAAHEAEHYKMKFWNTARNLDDLKAKGLDLGQINYAIGASKLPSAGKALAYRYAAYIMQAETAAANA